MHYLDFLRSLHAALEPATYLEIGVRDGRSLALSRADSVGIDPAFNISAEIRTRCSLHRTTSDEYFARPRGAGEEPERFDLVLIDGLHLFDFALRDFINSEARSHPWSVIVVDDVLPREPREASRSDASGRWTGDVFKLPFAIRDHRPDLVALEVDTLPTGLLMVMAVDPDSTVLRDRYAALVTEHVRPDPQVVPPAVFDRRAAVAPGRLLRSPAWRVLRDWRAGSGDADASRRELRSALAREFGQAADSGHPASRADDAAAPAAHGARGKA
jgi:hypothetical protein